MCSDKVNKSPFKNGDKGENNKGQNYTVVDYKGSDKVGISYDTHQDYIQYCHAGSLRKGKVSNKKDRSAALGKRFKNFYGDWATVINAEYSSNVEVVFDNFPNEVYTYGLGNLRKGVFRNPNNLNVKVGDRYKNNEQGTWCTVVSNDSCREIEVIFDGFPNNPQKFTSGNLLRGSFRNSYFPFIYGKGCLGEGKYKAVDPNGSRATYCKWSNAIMRCYCPKSLKIRPKYKDCTVSSDWLVYQNFAEWHINNEFYGLGYDLDKDLLVRGNRVYSAETCCLLPQEINKLITDSGVQKGEYPIGVCLHHDKSGFISRMSTDKGEKYLGFYKTPEEASAVYVEAKEKYVKYVAEKWKGKIEDRAYQALLNWTVYPE
ncbi:HNH endonuclease [Psychrobacter phage D'Alembert]|nr:HNH endonuclease [Psychrobacter phage D'Alembert]